MAFVWIQSPTRPGDDGKRYVTEEKAALLELSGWTTTTPPTGAPSPIPGDTPVTHDELAAALAGLGAGGVADATSSTKGVARIMAGTADDPRYPASRIEGQVQDVQISSAIARASAVSALAATVDELPFPEGSVNQTGAAAGKIPAVTGVSGGAPSAYGLKSIDELVDPTPVTAADLGAASAQALVAAKLGLAGGGTSLWSAGNAEAFSRFFGNADSAGASGRLWLSHFRAPIDTTITKLGFSSGGGAGSGITLARLALFTVAADGSLTLVARTASDTTLGSGTYTDYSRPLSTTGGFPASYTFLTGQQYALGWLQVGTTPTSLRSAGILGAGIAPLVSRRIPSQADIATTYGPDPGNQGWYEVAFLWGLAA